MRLGVPYHTHASVEGAQQVHILKLLADGDPMASALSAEQILVQSGSAWVSKGFHSPIVIDAVRTPDVLAPGDVIRVRPESSLVNVLWRRGARSNILFTTEQCNSLCLMCSQPPRKIDDSWRAGELLRLIPLIDKSESHLTVTGGEPTLLGTGLTSVLQACHRELPDTRLNILTNGRTFRNRTDAAEWITAGGENATWAVPLYADVPDIHDAVVAAPGAFDETLDGLYEMACHGANSEIRVVLHAMTVGRLRQLAAFIYRRLPFVRHVALMGLEPTGFAKGNRARLWIDPADYTAELSDTVGFLANRGVAVSIYNLPLCVLPETLWPFARQSISEWKNKFAEPCGDCDLRSKCAGFFASESDIWRSRAIRPIKTAGENK